MAVELDGGGGPSNAKSGDSACFNTELGQVLSLGWPNSVNQFLTFLPGLAMLHFLGSKPEHVAGAGMGFMFSNVAGLSLIIGTGAGAQPLISQAFGANNFQRCGDLLQRQLAIHSVLVLIIGVIWWNTKTVLVFFGQPADVASLAGQFLRWRIAALPALVLKENIANYLVAQRVMKLPMCVSMAAGILNILGFALFIPWLGFVGAPLAFTCANCFQALFLCIFARWLLPDRSAWPEWSWATSKAGWGEILKLALPGGILMLCEWWGWEMNLFFAGLLCRGGAGSSCVPLDVFPIVANTMVLAFMPNYGFSVAAGALIGNALGANDAARARRLAKVALCIAALVGGTIALSLVHARSWWGRLFSDDAEVIDLTGQVVPTVAAYIFLDCLGPGALVNICRSMSVVTLPAIINFMAFYVVAGSIWFDADIQVARAALGHNWLVVGACSRNGRHGIFTIALSLLLG
eukprot:TRINITY_DN13715_c0_g1_i1.p1 TRINITY_DN13715_c0_g1~~TRINITY_DN13715_c0_g1_i1.p1  ORF type:complete len:462 (+),score=52.75 TRINITY_DN13715_c0_g1_i1:101-1486(+)